MLTLHSNEIGSGNSGISIGKKVRKSETLGTYVGTIIDDVTVPLEPGSSSSIWASPSDNGSGDGSGNVVGSGISGNGDNNGSNDANNNGNGEPMPLYIQPKLAGSFFSNPEPAADSTHSQGTPSAIQTPSAAMIARYAQGR
jgi:hypothetical protein